MADTITLPESRSIMFRRVTTISAPIVLIACATYSDQIVKIRTTMESGEPAKAIELLEGSDVAKRRRDEVLFLMEKGMLNYLSNRMSEAVKDWAKALKRSEELYTLSISQTLGSLVVSENITDYEGEDHEKVLLPIFSSMAFFSSGELSKALVEIRRAYEVMNQLKLEQDDSRPKTDGFPYFVSGLIYEASNNWDAAIVEYRKALTVYSKISGENFSGISKEIAAALWRIAEYRRREDILNFLNEKGYSKPLATLSELNSKAEVFIVVEDGHSPIKVPQDYAINLGQSVVNVSFPRYQSISRPRYSTQILCDNVVCGSAQRSSDVGILAENALERRRLRDFAKMTARLILKEQARQQAQKRLGNAGSAAIMIANFITERADTRSWTLLPANIQVARISIPADRNVSISLNQNSAVGANQWTVNLPPGKKKLLRIRTF